ncbi:DUF7619 domain-containing protein [Psychroserpens sp. BH13MA-6]
MKKQLLYTYFALISVMAFSQNPPSIYLSDNYFGVIEGNSYEFFLYLNSASTTDITVNLLTADDTADASDYTPISMTVTIPAGQLESNVISVATTNDSNIEENESFFLGFFVTSGNTSNSYVSESITIRDNDTIPTLYIASTATLIEGEIEDHTMSLSNYYNSDVTIDFTTSSDNADSSDYVETIASVTIFAGEDEAQFPIITLDDGNEEPLESYIITATVITGNTVNEVISIYVTIIDNDVMPTLNITAYDSFEFDSAYVSASLSNYYNSDVVIEFISANGTADNNDYSNVNETKTIIAGNYSTTFVIPLTDDDIDEPSETINYTINVLSGNTTNTVLTGTITIIDNDGLPDVRIMPIINNNISQGDVNLPTTEEGYPVKFKLRLTDVSPIDTDITITTTNGTADSSDFTTATFTTTIPAGYISNYFEEFAYETILDQIEEEDEDFLINVQVTSGNTFDDNITKQAIIQDNYVLNAQPDRVISILEVGTSFQVLDNDTLEGLPVDPSNVNASMSPNTIGVTMSPSGVLSVPSSVPLGYHNVAYQICESSDPTICDTATVRIHVTSPLEVITNIMYVDFNGDGFTSAGDTIEYEFTVANNGNDDITNIDATVNWPDLDIVGGPLPSLAPGEIDTTSFRATHIITQDDINFGYYNGGLEGVSFQGTYYGNQVNTYLYDPNLNFQLQQSDGIKLNAFIDTNGNGTQESGEVNFPLGQFNFEINNDGMIHNLYVSPHYLYESNPNTTYNLTYTVDPDYAEYNYTDASFSNITVPIGSGITTYNFPITVTPYEDLSINIQPGWTPPRPGFEYNNLVTINNNSNETVNLPTIDFNHDNVLNFVSILYTNPFSTVPPSEITTTSSGFSFDYPSLLPYETVSFYVNLEVPVIPTVSLGQLVNNNAEISLLSGDISPANNTSNLTQTIVGAYDPNDMTERHGPEILHSEFSITDYLTYTIRFENIGTANAINIRVEDLLDEQLDETTLKMVDASHSYTLERVGKQLEWNFFGIDLPPSIDDNSSIGHGYITFKIKPFPDYEIGDIIPNTAEIYFDFNPPIITNTWTTEFIDDNLSDLDYTYEHLTVYPNPTAHTLYILNNSVVNSLTITSLLGEIVMNAQPNKTQIDLDISSLSNGIYLMSLESDNGEKTVKIVKQ